MNRRLLVVLVCALFISAGASYVVFQLAGGHQAPAKPAGMTKVVVAARDLDIGTLVHDADLRIADWPGAAPKGATLKKAGALERGVLSPIYQGEPITENRLAPPGSGGGLASIIPAGMRACAVRVNEVVGVAGFVIPGMRVDVLMTGVPPGDSSGAGPAVKTLLQNIQVLSAGANIEKDKEGKPQQVQVVNLLVTPAQAEILSLAGNETRIQLVLRNPMDNAITEPTGTYMAELFGAPKTRPLIKAPPGNAPAPPHGPAPAPRVQQPAVEPPPAVDTIEIVNGSTHTVTKFKTQGEAQ